MNLVDGEWIVTGPKAGSLRDVALPPHILDSVKAHLRDHVGKGRDALLFPPRSGAGFMRESSLVKVYYPARHAAGRPDDLHFYDLRHIGLSYAARAGATTAELMSRARTQDRRGRPGLPARKLRPGPGVGGEAVEDGRRRVGDLGHSLISQEFARVSQSQPESARVN